MKSKNKHLRPPPVKPWMLDNTSSSSLRNMEIGVPPDSKPLPNPPVAVLTYKTKPLPPLPLRRSGISRFSTEVQNAFKTPIGREYHISKTKRQRRESGIAIIVDAASQAYRQGVKDGSGFQVTDRDSHSPTPSRSSPRLANPIGADSTTSLSPNESALMSSRSDPAPPSTGSVQKLLDITEESSVASLVLSHTSFAPSGHNSTQKTKQIIGFEVSVYPSSASRGSTDEVSPLTPESRSSSIYSQDRSNPDSDAYHGQEQGSTPGTSVSVSSHLQSPGSWRPSSIAASAVPASLHIVKTEDDKAGITPLTSSCFSATNHYNVATGVFKKDLYHTTVSELTKSTTQLPCSKTGSNSVPAEAPNFLQPGFKIMHPPQRQQSSSDRTYHPKARFLPQLTRLDTLNATRYNAPVKTPYPLPMSKFEFDDDDDDDATPTQSDYHNKGSSKTVKKRPSVLDRMIRRVSTPLSPPTRPTVLTAPGVAHKSQASALPSPAQLMPPPLLKHRKVKSHDILLTHTYAAASTSTDNTGKASGIHSHMPASGSRRASHEVEKCPSPDIVAAIAMPNNNTSRSNDTRTSSGQLQSVATTRSPTPLPQHASRTATPFPHNGPRSDTPTPFPSISAPAHHRHHPDPSQREAPPLPPRGPTPPPVAGPVPATRSFADSAKSTISAWASRASERLERARQSAGFCSRAESRRFRLKGNIKVIGPGKLEAGTAPMVVPVEALVVNGDGQLGGRRDDKREREPRQEKVMVGMRLEKYSARSAASGVGGCSEVIVSPHGAAGETYAGVAPVKTAEMVKGRARADGMQVARVWI